MNSFAVLVDCPDSYFDILEVFFACLNRHWPERKATIYVTTNEKDIKSLENTVFIKCGNNLNSIERSKIALNSIKESYLLILDCDCFFFGDISEDYLNYLVAEMKNNRFNYVRLWKTPNKEQKKYKTQTPSLYFCNKKARYSKCLMANLWKKETYLEEVVSSGEDGWSIESKWLAESKNETEGFFENHCYCDSDPLHILHGILKGRWIRKALRKLLKFGFIKKEDIVRKKVSIGQTFKYNCSMFLMNHISSKTVYKLKKIIGRNKFVSND